MKIGKLSNETLERILFGKLKNKRAETCVGPAVGCDCAQLDLDGDICVVSADPITGTKDDIARLVVNVCTNDIAAAGAEAVGLMVTMLIPPHATLEETETVIDELIEACEEKNIDLIGGHTEVSEAVTRYVLSGVAFGRRKKGELKTARPGDKLVMSKTAALEGTGIIAANRTCELKKHLAPDEINKARDYLKKTSVLAEGRIGASLGVSLMHDATEGGILGAAWEMANACGLGVTVDEAAIPVTDLTRRICGIFGISPLRLISSGVMMFITNDAPALIEALKKEYIPAAVIGEMTEGSMRLMTNEGETELCPPETDELYKAVEL